MLMAMGGAGERKAAAAEMLQERLLPGARSGHGYRAGRDTGKGEKTYLDVLGVCCSAEVALVERLLEPLDGVRAVSVVVPSRTVIVEHDPTAVSQSQIVKALNKAGLEASVRAYGSSGVVGRWPSPYIVASGALLAASLFAPLLPPLRWLSLGAACAGAPPMLLRGLAAATRLSLDINVLMLVAVAGAVALGDYTEAGAIVFLFITAEWLETLACTKAGAGMSALMRVIPPKAVIAGTGEVVSVRDVAVGDVVAVRAGEVVPVDGVVVDGRSEVDESSLTGESFPVLKQVASEAWAGTLNRDGYIAVRTTALAENSTVAKMQRLVEAAQKSRSKTQRLIDSCAKYYTPAVVALAAGVVLVPLLLGAQDMDRWFRLALVSLVSACPCALVLSTPVATFCSLLRAARMGVLVKGGDVLESLGEIRVAAFDKTGTITKGEFTINKFHVVGEQVEMDQLLYWVSSIESKSNHLMAAALVEYSQSRSIHPKPEDVTEFRIYPGEGVYGEINGRRVYIGNRRIMARSSSSRLAREEEVIIPAETGDDELRGGGGASLGYVICDGDLVGAFSLSDDCRTGAAEAIQELRSMGIKTVMLTGDNSAAAARAQEQLRGVLEELHSGLLPEDKVRLVRELKAASGPTLMVGDGMNDAPALAAADVGVSMGLSGSAAAMETSHATLMSSDILRVPAAVRLGRRTRRAVAVNVTSSVAAKAAVLALAVAWRPVLWAAVLADVGTCLLVVLHSMTLLAEEPLTTAAAQRRSGRAAESCRATVRSLALRSQLVQASAVSGQRPPREESEKSCGCCEHAEKQNRSPEHSVAIDMPAPEKGEIAGCCGAGESCAVSTVPPTTAIRASQEFRAGEDDTSTDVETAERGKGRRECDPLQGVTRRGCCRDATCCSGGTDGGISALEK